MAAREQREKHRNITETRCICQRHLQKWPTSFNQTLPSHWHYLLPSDDESIGGLIHWLDPNSSHHSFPKDPISVQKHTPYGRIPSTIPYLPNLPLPNNPIRWWDHLWVNSLIDHSPQHPIHSQLSNPLKWAMLGPYAKSTGFKITKINPQILCFVRLPGDCGIW